MCQCQLQSEHIVLSAARLYTLYMLTNNCIAHLNTTQTELQGHTAVTQVLIEKGAELNIANTIDGHTPLHLAYLRGHSEVVQLLITAGASETVLDKKGNTPMVSLHSQINCTYTLQLMQDAKHSLRCDRLD
jgi:ankyrin repeat protein